MIDKKIIDKIIFALVGTAGALVLLFFMVPTPSYFTDEELKMYDYSNSNILVIKPFLTEVAYGTNGFYYYYNGTCGESCLTIDIPKEVIYDYESSLRTIARFEALGAKTIDDIKLNLADLKDYDKIILLHNEYVTQEFFDAITSHPNVIYLYPNALYGKIEINDNKMTLVQGHGYNGMSNGFGWEYDNTRPYELDTTCKSMEFIDIPNGKQLNCYPENFVLNNTWFFGYVRDV